MVRMLTSSTAFASQEHSVLFPEFVSRSVQTGFDDFNKLRSILASRVKIDDNTYKSIYMDESVMTAAEKSLAVVNEGAALPVIEIKTAEHAVQISKYGRYLQATYKPSAGSEPRSLPSFSVPLACRFSGTNSPTQSMS